MTLPKNSNNRIYPRIAILFILLSLAPLVGGCSCSCSSKDGDAVRRAPEGDKPATLTAENMKTAFEAYLDELRVNATRQNMAQLAEISRDQQKTRDTFKMQEGGTSSLLEDSTGKFETLKPLVKENRLDDVVKELDRVMSMNQDNEDVQIEGNRKMALCHYVKGDQVKYALYLAKYNKLVDEKIVRFEKEEAEYTKKN